LERGKIEQIARVAREHELIQPIAQSTDAVVQNQVLAGGRRAGQSLTHPDHCGTNMFALVRRRCYRRHPPMTDEELNARFASIEASIKAEGTVTRHHFDVVGEGLRIDIKIVAEGHDGLRQKTDDLKEGFPASKQASNALRSGSSHSKLDRHVWQIAKGSWKSVRGSWKNVRKRSRANSGSSPARSER
jgi:hypothetical protein